MGIISEYFLEGNICGVTEWILRLRDQGRSFEDEQVSIQGTTVAGDRAVRYRSMRFQGEAKTENRK